MADRPVLTEPARVPGCTCTLVLVEPGNATGTAPAWLAGPHRFQTTVITQVAEDCIHHGFRTSLALAADLRYGD